MNRRAFLVQAGVGVASLGLGSELSPGATPAKLSDLPVSVFSKHLEFLGYEALADTAAELGFDGIDLTVRRGGHVLPDRVRKDLPVAAKAIRKAGLRLQTICTDVLPGVTPYCREVLEAAHDQGIPNYRIGESRYDGRKPIPPQIEAWDAAIHELVQLNREVGILGSIQNHSDHRLGGLGLDLWEAMRKEDPAFLGCHYDVCHSVIEGPLSWRIDFSLLKDRINALIFKDFVFTKAPWGIRVEFVPIGEGMVPWERYLRMLQREDIRVPLILHMEHAGENASPDTIKACLKQDLETLRALLKQAS